MIPADTVYLLIGSGDKALLLGRRSYLTENFDDALSFASEEEAKIYMKKHGLEKLVRIVRRSDKDSK